MLVIGDKGVGKKNVIKKIMQRDDEENKEEVQLSSKNKFTNMTEYTYVNSNNIWTIFSTSKPDLIIKDLISPLPDYLVIVLSALDTYDSAKLKKLASLFMTLNP